MIILNKEKRMKMMVQMMIVIIYYLFRWIELNDYKSKITDIKI
jgi:hypothetical protein